jgi:hypothetical protein
MTLIETWISGLDLVPWMEAVFGHWRNWRAGAEAGCAAVLAVGIPAWFRVWTVPRRRYTALFLGFCFAGVNYVAWHDAYTSVKAKDADSQGSGPPSSERRENAPQTSSSAVTETAYDTANNAALLNSKNPALKKNLLQLIDEVRKFQTERIHGTPPFDIKIDKDKQPSEWNDEWQKYTDKLAAYNKETEALYKTKFDPSISLALKKITDDLGIDTVIAQHESKGKYSESERLLFELNRIADKL